jgi:hypothetical protein
MLLSSDLRQHLELAGVPSLDSSVYFLGLRTSVSWVRLDLAKVSVAFCMLTAIMAIYMTMCIISRLELSCLIVKSVLPNMCAVWSLLKSEMDTLLTIMLFHNCFSQLNYINFKQLKVDVSLVSNLKVY